MNNTQKVGFWTGLKGFFDNAIFKVGLVFLIVILIGQTEISIGGEVSLKKHKFSVLESIADTVANAHKGYKVIRKVF